MDKFTETDQDNLADLIWWIKGFNAAKRSESEFCDFGTEHIESLAKARRMLRIKEEAK